MATPISQCNSSRAKLGYLLRRSICKSTSDDSSNVLILSKSTVLKNRTFARELIKVCIVVHQILISVVVGGVFPVYPTNFNHRNLVRLNQQLPKQRCLVLLKPGECPYSLLEYQLLLLSVTTYCIHLTPKILTHSPFFHFLQIMSLNGKVAIVTGGASGFGLGIVEKFVACGARVVITDISQTNGENAVARFGSNTLFIKANVVSAADWKQVLDTTLDKFDSLDIVVNNAGTTYRNKPTLEVTEADFDQVFNVNVKGIFLSVNTIVPYFIERGKGGTFIQISSTAALRPRPGLTWYNATKGAVSTASKSLAIEYGKHNIRFNCVCPVAGDTPLLGNFMGEDTPERRKIFLESIPLGRFSKPEDIANSVAFLASDDAAFLTGLDLEVDGGRCI